MERGKAFRLVEIRSAVSSQTPFPAGDFGESTGPPPALDEGEEEVVGQLGVDGRCGSVAGLC